MHIVYAVATHRQVEEVTSFASRTAAPQTSSSPTTWYALLPGKRSGVTRLGAVALATQQATLHWYATGRLRKLELCVATLDIPLLRNACTIAPDYGSAFSVSVNDAENQCASY